MLKLALLVTLQIVPGCLYVHHEEGSYAEAGLIYDCVYLRNLVKHHENVCGPLDMDVELVLDNFHPADADKGANLTCTVTTKPCIYNPEPVDGQ